MSECQVAYHAWLKVFSSRQQPLDISIELPVPALLPCVSSCTCRLLRGSHGLLAGQGSATVAGSVSAREPYGARLLADKHLSLKGGQCGNQIGAKFWEVIADEHGIDPTGSSSAKIWSTGDHANLL